MSDLSDQLARCDQEIQRCREFQNNELNPHSERVLAAMGEVDWMVARLYIEESEAITEPE